MELEELRQRLRAESSFLIHGSSGAGKTLLLRSVTANMSKVLYCADSRTGHSVFHSLATELFRRKEARIRRVFGRSGEEAIKHRSVLVLRGLVLDALHKGKYRVVLDHLSATSAGLASDVRDMMLWADTPAIVIARSEHMEDTGFLRSYFALRSERMHIAPFPRSQAKTFAEDAITQVGLEASNQEELLDRIVELSHGLPGAIIALVRMSLLPKYRIGQYVMLSPLYIDYRLAWHAANAL
jgi:hypothetical protein